MKPMKLIVSLIKSRKCISVLMYGLEVIDLNQTNSSKLDSPLILYQVFDEMFKSFDKQVIDVCILYVACES